MMKWFEKAGDGIDYFISRTPFYGFCRVLSLTVGFLFILFFLYLVILSCTSSGYEVVYEIYNGFFQWLHTVTKTPTLFKPFPKNQAGMIIINFIITIGAISDFDKSFRKKRMDFR